ncbi:MAG: DUF3293 domain-containing protein [Rudaea sp.]
MNAADESVALVAAYRAADYWVRLAGGRRVALRVGAACPHEIRELLSRDDAAIGGLLTAWNPFSRQTPRATNRRRQRELLGRLRAAGARVFVGAGTGTDWREPGLAAFGLRMDTLDALARDFGQNAILTFCAAGPVRLRVYRDDWRGAISCDDADLAPALVR